MRKTVHKKILQFLCLTGLWLCTGCNTDSVYTSTESPGNRPYLSLTLPVAGNVPHPTRAIQAAGIPELGENDVNRIDVFVYTADGICLHHERQEKTIVDGRNGQTGGDVSLGLLKRDVKELGMLDIYVVANYPGADLEKMPLDELKTRTLSTEFKYMTRKGAIEDPFLMDGHIQVDGSKWADGNTDVTVPLKRAAAKIMVKVSYSTAENGTTYRSGGPIQKKMINVATTATLLETGNVLETREKRGLISMTEYVDATAHTALFYSYPNRWNFNPESSEVDLFNESYLLLNIPVKVYSSEEAANDPGSDYTERLQNYYYIPLRSGAGGKEELLRNCFYHINVSLKAAGSGEETRPTELEATVEVQPWQEETVSVGNDNARFLEVSRNYIEMNDTQDDSSVLFYSSSAVDVHIKENSVSYIDKFGVEKLITPRQTAYPAGRTYYPSVSKEDDGQANSGKVIIHSTELVNVMKKFIVVVTNGDGLSREIEVYQYPLEYITSTQGWYSTRKDFLHTYQQYVPGGINSMRTDPALFTAKYVGSYTPADGKSTTYEYSYNNQGKVQQGDLKTLPNAHMYHVHITSMPQDADVSYRLGHPLMTNGVTDPGAANAHIVSPSFMIASQLGSIVPDFLNKTNVPGSTELTPAQLRQRCEEQCRNYVEVTGVVWSNGKADYSKAVRYDDWRLPTEAELMIIKKYQDESNSAVDAILTGDRYYAANGPINIKGTRYIYLRCVRDAR